MATIPNGKGTRALAMLEKGGTLQPIEIGRPATGPNDVRIKIHYCGQCHSDVHATNGDWGFELYPLAPGHEIAGTVIESGSDSSKFTTGQKVGVGCMVMSCFDCDLCGEGLEQHCGGMVQTYSSPFPEGRDHDDCAGFHTNGGYSEEIVVHERFVFVLPDSIPMEYVGPLLCAGITTYSPLSRLVKHKQNQKVGVVGFGGLGMMTVKLAKAMGAEVTVFSRGTSKAGNAKELGADLVDHTDETKLGSLARSLDTIIDTVSVGHEVAGLIGTLKVGGTYCFLGGVPQPYSISAMQLLFSRYTLTGSLIGGVPETAEMLEFCAQHNILPEIDVIPASGAAKVFADMQSGTAGAVRKVIDMSTIGELFE